jgi:hypothetical protein
MQFSNSMEDNSETDSCSASLEQGPSTGSYPKSDEFSSQRHTRVFLKPILILSSIDSEIFQMGVSLHVIHLKILWLHIARSPIPDNPTPILLFLIRSLNNKLRGLGPRANYTDRVTAACQRSHFQLFGIRGVAWSVQRISTAVFSIFRPVLILFKKNSVS